MNLSFRKICWTPVWIVLFLMGTGAAAFGETTVLFQKTYQKNLGSPVAYIDRFQVPTGFSNLQIIVTNGAEEYGEVKNVSVELNGTEVVSSRDLKGTGTSQKAVVNFESSNVIEVTLRGPGGNAVNILLVGDKEEQDTPPIVYL